MRNRLLVLTAAVLLSACADDQHATAPASGSNLSSRSANGDVRASALSSGNPQAKPIDQVGFTTINYLSSGNIVAPVGKTTGGSVNCPAGSIAVSGGYSLYLTAGAPAPVVTSTRPVGVAPNPFGWAVDLSNEAVGAGQAVFQIFVVCAS